MRILVLAEEPPLPPMNGSRLQLVILLREVRKEHDVKVLSVADPGGAAVAEPDMRLIAPLSGGPAMKLRRLASATLHGLPMWASTLTARMRGPLREEVAAFRPDVVHMDSATLAGLHPDLGGVPSVLGILDAYHLNVEAKASMSTGLRRRLHQAEADRIRRFGERMYRLFDRVVAVSQEDRQEFLALDPSLRVEVIPNGVDLEAFAPDGRPRDPHRIMFTGVMSYAPNVITAEFLARRVFPRVQDEVPGARLLLVGRSPAPSVAALGSEEGIEVTGEVPEMRPWLSGAGVYACPMRAGTGIKNKLLEAMANGLPCVVTPLALQGIGARPGRDLLVADDEVGLARHLIEVIRDDRLARRLGEAARAYVRQHHRWEEVGRAYSRLYRTVVRERGASPEGRPPAAGGRDAPGPGAHGGTRARRSPGR